MSTQEQIKANRQNAQKSTGPKTAEGKAVVSKNAVKHGLFAAEAVITGEDPAEYEAYRDQFLAEMAPAGAVETMLVERFISLAWRLRRAERIQNQAIDVMIARDEPSPLSKRLHDSLPKDLQEIDYDTRGAGPELVLGRSIIKDYSYSRVLDRMILYERRIENSTLRMLREFKKQQIMRRIEQQDISYDQAVGGTEALTGKNINLKKQTQFVPGQNGAKSYVKGDYDKSPLCGAQDNKAKQTQSLLAHSTAVGSKKGKLPTAANRLTG